MTNKNPHEDSSCPVEQDVLEESTEKILDEGDQNLENGFEYFSDWMKKRVRDHQVTQKN